MSRSTLALAAALAVVMASCGVSVEDEARPLPTQTATAPTPTEPTPSVPAEDEVTLWLVREGGLQAVPRTAEPPVLAQDRIDLLVVGPTDEEAEAGIRTAVVSVVSGEPLVVTAREADVFVPEIESGQVAVVLEPEFLELLSDEQVLVLGQVVTTLAVDGINEVLFVTEGGQTVGVPLADGRLREGPVGPEDYAELIA